MPRLVVIVVTLTLLGGCASTGAVPRPFPVPGGARRPRVAELIRVRRPRRVRLSRPRHLPEAPTGIPFRPPRCRCEVHPIGTVAKRPGASTAADSSSTSSRSTAYPSHVTSDGSFKSVHASTRPRSSPETSSFLRPSRPALRTWGSRWVATSSCTRPAAAAVWCAWTISALRSWATRFVGAKRVN